jgi:hypothetical protein
MSMDIAAEIQRLLDSSEQLDARDDYDTDAWDDLEQEAKP